jgi:hypothetical protein
MNRTVSLLIAVIILAVANIGWVVWNRWGLITIHAESEPLSQIIRSIEKQAGVTVKTNIDPATPVRLHIDRVPVSEALESLAAVTDSNWRLAYIFAADKGSIANLLGSFTASQRPEGWRTISYPLPDILEAESGGPVPDPRREEWDVKPAEPKTVQAYLEQAAQNVDASFVFPEGWNPFVAAAPKSGAIRKVAPRLASAAKGRQQEVFLLTQRGGGPDGEGRAWSGGERRRGGDREAMLARAEARINKLPAEQRTAALAELEERRSFFTGMRNLSPEERRARGEEFREREDVQERIEKREAERNARRTPEQRIQRAKRYVDNKRRIQASAE